MISLQLMLLILVIFFMLAGTMRGWKKEVLALTGMIAAFAILSNYGYIMFTSLGTVLPGLINLLGGETNPQIAWFWLQVILFGLFAFFGYQVVGPAASARIGGRFGGRLGATLESQFIGGLFGAINGFMLVGGLWGFLEYQLGPTGYTQLPAGATYPFAAITRPVVAADAFNITSYLPQGLIPSPMVWLILFFIAFVFILIALI